MSESAVGEGEPGSSSSNSTINAVSLNDLLRFALELTGLAALAWFGLIVDAGVWSWIFAILFPILAAAAWGTFAVPGDPSRSGRAPLPVSGHVRLALELTFFGLATIALARVAGPPAALALAGVVIVHYAISHKRLRWLLSQT